jgi:hypothetical protein
MKISTTLALLFFGVSIAHAVFIPIPLPDPIYQASTTKIAITAADGTTLSSITDGTLAVNFLINNLPDTRQVATVPSTYQTWSSPPFSESATPRVLTAQGDFGPLTLTFSQPLTTFGMEVEPDPFGFFAVTASFYNGTTLVGSISEPQLGGFMGARLFAATVTGGDVFTSVVLSTPNDEDLTVAQLRYILANGNGNQVPEAGTSASLLGLSLAAIALLRRKLA